jgi:hypothetical protein
MNITEKNIISANESKLLSNITRDLGTYENGLPNGVEITPKTLTAADEIKSTAKSGVIPATDPKVLAENPKKKAEKINDTIKTTNAIISLTNNLADITEHHEFDGLLNSSAGALTATKGLVSLNEADSETNKTKVVMSSISQVASGVGTVLNAVNIPEAEFLLFTGKLAGLGAEQQNLEEQIEKKDSRGIAGTTVSLAKGAWGSVVSGVNVAKLAANTGLKIGIVKPATVGKITTAATKVAKVADKIAIPFAVAGTGLSFWDTHKSINKAENKLEELKLATQERVENTYKNKVLKRQPESPKEKALKRELETLRQNSRIMELSSAVSAVSTIALIANVALPATAAVAGPVALGGSIAASLISSLADHKTRTAVINACSTAIKKYDHFVYKVESLLPARAAAR